MLARLIRSQDLAPDVRQFFFEAVDVDRLEYIPGQFVSLTEEILNPDGQGKKAITRAYSLASAPASENRFELCLNRVDGGRMSPHLFSMQPGDTIPMSAPLGTFVLRDHALDTGHHSVFIATGTGVAPFRAILQAVLPVTSARFTLLLGVRYQSHLLYRTNFEALARSHSNFRFLPVLSRPDETWQGRVGHVQHHLQEVIRETEFPAVDFYLCGLKAMVDDVRAILKEMGFDRKQIRYEKYD